MLTWNIGSFTNRRTILLTLLATHLPHFCCLQECALTHGQKFILAQDLRSLGYYACVGKDNLCTIVREGFNIAPIARSPDDLGFRIQRLALQLGDHRVLVRHRHAHSSSAAERCKFDSLLQADYSDRLTIDVGDFNEFHYFDASDDQAVVFPSCSTYRLNPARDDWSSTIDGAVVSTFLAASASAEGLDAVSGAQHRPVLVHLGLTPSFHDTTRWVVSEPITMGAWTQEQKNAFDEAVTNDIDQAWSILLDAAGAPEARFARHASVGGWAAGSRSGELHGLWKTFRRQLHDLRHDAANITLGIITSLIDDANSLRLQSWRETISTRGGAAAWVTSKVLAMHELVLPPFGSAVYSAADVAAKLGVTLAARWNASIYHIHRTSGFRTDFARFPLDMSSLELKSTAPPIVH